MNDTVLKDAVKTMPLISEDERARRKTEVDFARRSVRYEGHILCDEMEALNEKYINGQFTSEEFSVAIGQSIEKRYQQWRAGNIWSNC